MSQVISLQLFSWAVYGISLFVISLFTVKKIPLFSRLCMQGIIGASFILILNCVLCKINLCLGINIFTVGISALLGMPGIALMYLMLYVI